MIALGNNHAVERAKKTETENPNPLSQQAKVVRSSNNIYFFGNSFKFWINVDDMTGSIISPKINNIAVIN